MREIKRRRRARQRDQLGLVFDGMEQLLYVFQKGMCFYCHKRLNVDYHMDHKLPLARGGLHDWENICLACPSCNLTKHTKTAEEFFDEIYSIE